MIVILLKDKKELDGSISSNIAIKNVKVFALDEGKTFSLTY